MAKDSNGSTERASGAPRVSGEIVRSTGGGQATYNTANLERALGILELLAATPSGLGISDIATRLDIPKNSVFRIANTLAMHGYCEQDDDSKDFRLTRKLLAMGFTALGEHNVIEESLGPMRALRDQTGETALIATLVGTEGIVLDQVPGSHPFKFMVDPGTRFHLHTSAPGKALLAFLPEGERDRVLSRLVLARFNERTITNLDALGQVLAQVHEQGYATDCAEEIEGVHCLGAPVLDRRGYPVAAIWVTGPRDRLPEQSFGEVGAMVRGQAMEISRRLGYGVFAATARNVPATVLGKREQA